MKCCFKGCKNEVFENLDKCALHCSSENIIDEDKYLSEFNNFFINYILAKIKNLNGLRCLNWHGILQKLSLKDISFVNFYQNEILKEILNTKVLYITNICFPKIKNKSLSNFCYITEQFDSVVFESCFFGCNAVVSESHKYYYKKCLFNGDLTIKAGLMYLGEGAREDKGEKFDTLFLYEESYRYYHCNFLGDVNITNDYSHKKNINYNYIGFNVFEECDFKKNISIKDIKMNGIFIKVASEKNNKIDEGKLIFNEISILDCNFDSSFKVNGSEDKEEGFPIKIEKITIKNTKFKSKFELKNAIVKNINFNNSNVSGVFDVYQSSFMKARFYKSIFEDFAAFEYVVFGNEKKENITEFIYTTFKDFSNFRNTKFTSGLNFSSANIKQEPNFLNTDINLVGTDRETLRIVKNSFAQNNNKIEANRFFVHEMNSYREEMKGITYDNVIFIKIKEYYRNIKNHINKIVGCLNDIVDCIVSLDNSFFAIYFIIVITPIFILFELLFFLLRIPIIIFKYINNDFNFKHLVLNINYFISSFGESYIRPIIIFLFSIGFYTYISEVHADIFGEEPVEWYVALLRDFVTQDWFVSLSKFLNACAANVPLFSKALESKSGIQFISLLFFIWFGILTWQIIVAVKRNTQH